jgi:hypothetical protein
MQTFYYAQGDDPSEARLATAIREAIPAQAIECFTGLESFRERLRKPIDPDSIAVISAMNLDVLRRMQGLGDLLSEVFVVLVIPDRKRETIELAHHLLPRFMSRHQDDFVDLGQVLQKIVRTPH